MTFVSYAQNYEDVMLWRALGDIEKGFWIDVGAAHPTELSVTRAFYDRGWHGVNIEPEPDYAAALRNERSRDINLAVAIGEASGRAVLQRIAGTGLSTFDAAIAAGHVPAGYRAQPMEVEVTTLEAVCAAHAPRDIHFLKIDVEGAEREVVLGANFRTHRPWIIVAEATFPFSPVPRIDAFADVLAAADYRQCWFDGLNAFFLAAEHEARLAPAFRVPPNFFDGFVPAAQVFAMARAEAAERRVADLHVTLNQALATERRARARAEHRVAELDAAWHEAWATNAAEHLARMAAERRVAELDFALSEALEVEAAERCAAETAERRAVELGRAAQEAELGSSATSPGA